MSGSGASDTAASKRSVSNTDHGEGIREMAIHGRRPRSRLAQLRHGALGLALVVAPAAHAADGAATVSPVTVVGTPLDAAGVPFRARRPTPRR